jgi:TrmH family RNA methyltransferase
MNTLRSRDNPQAKRWSRLARDTRFRKREGRALLEGPHLVSALLQQNLAPLAVLVTESSLFHGEIAQIVRKIALTPFVLSEGLFRAIVDTENPPGIAAEIAIPVPKPRLAQTTVFLEGVQDPSNVGAIMRSAAAFGADAVVLDRACADPWSPKALRAGMGGHFLLQIRETKELKRELERFDGRVLCTVPRGGVTLGDADLGGKLGWLFGAEGRGVTEASLRQASLKVTIPIAKGSESLNVAASAAICLYAAFSRRAAGS